MDTNTDLAEIESAQNERIERARNSDMSVRVARQDPLLVEVTNEASGNTYTVIPDALYCSGPDHRHRGLLCKHIVFLTDRDDRIAEATRQAMTDELTQLQDQATRLSSQLSEIRRKRTALKTVRDDLDVILDYDGGDEDQPATIDSEKLDDTPIEVLRELHDDRPVYTFDKETVGADWLVDDDGDDGFDEMVDDLRGDE